MRFMRAVARLTTIYAAHFIGTVLGTNQLVYLQIAFLHNSPDLAIFASAHGDIKPAVSG